MALRKGLENCQSEIVLRFDTDDINLKKTDKLLKIINHDAVRIERLITDYTQMLKDEAALSREKMNKINLVEIINGVVEDFNQDLINQNK